MYRDKIRDRFLYNRKIVKLQCRHKAWAGVISSEPDNITTLWKSLAFSINMWKRLQHRARLFIKPTTTHNKITTLS